MKLIDIVKMLETQGHKVNYRTRSDGGILITSIDSESTKGASGNSLARRMIGESLSEKQQTQLLQNKSKIVKPKLSQNVQKAIRKTQASWRKNQPKTAGKITTKKVRWRIEKYGEEEALKSLSQAEKYAQGLAYDKNIDALITRFDRYTLFAHDTETAIAFANIIRIIEKNRYRFKESWIAPINEIMYELEKGGIDYRTAITRIQIIIS